MYHWSSPLDNFGPEECSLARKLCQRTGGHMLTTKIGSRLDQPVWPVAPGGLTGLWRCSRFGRSRPVWPVGLTGLTGPSRVRVQLEIFIDLDLVIWFLAGQVHPPYKYKGSRPIETFNRSKNISIHYFSIFLLPFRLSPNPSSSNLPSIVLPSSPWRLKAF